VLYTQEERMNKRWYAGITLLLMVGSAAIASERAANAYKTHKISPNAVMISCNDEREPVVKKFENTTLIVVTCQTAPQR
jgi:hypothetical protein